MNPHNPSTSQYQGLSYGLPPARGLYDPAHEADACGIGFVADVQGRRTHRIVEKAIEAVCCLTHRGAVAADAKTGDGAGILTQIPHRLLRAGLGKGQGKLLRNDEDLAVAMIFFPRDADKRHRAYQICEKVIEESELVFLEWRRVPIDPLALGESAKETCPEIRQLLLARMDGMTDAEFERVCYCLRKRMENRVAAEGIEGFYVPSFSSKTIIYKGLVVAPQLPKFYVDLQDEKFESAIALYHQRYSTNTFPTWFLAQPFRFLAHNGEINTLQGNVNWIRAKELAENSSIWNSKEALAELRPIIQPGGSDSAGLDNALESIVMGGRDLLHTVMMMTPEAHEAIPEMDDDLRAFYEYHACLQEPWDGPAALSFTDGRIIGAGLDRNGLRPSRYQLSDDGMLVVASEVGVVDLDGAKVLEKGRLGPGQLLALDTQTGELMKNDEIKARYAKQSPYRQWVNQYLVKADAVATSSAAANGNGQHTNGSAQPPIEYSTSEELAAVADTLLIRQKIFGFTNEDVESIVKPMVKTAKEPVGSMGDDTPLAVLSEKPRLLYTYFRQRFAQVTNPPIDPLREKLVMSLTTLIGPYGNLWSEEPEACQRIEFKSPILTDEQLAWLRSGAGEAFKSITLDATWPVNGGPAQLQQEVNRLRQEAVEAVREGHSIIILSDRNAGKERALIPTLMAVGAVHHHLIRSGVRTRASIVAESGEARDDHQMACLLGYGASAVNPYLAYETIRNIVDSGKLDGWEKGVEKALESYRKSLESGLRKIMSKMGISTLASYHGAQIFEALGLAPELVDECFTSTPSRIRGAGYADIATDTLRLHETAFPPEMPKKFDLEDFYYLRYRKGGEQHAFSPTWFKPFHEAVRKGDYEGQYQIYKDSVNNREMPIAIRDLLDYQKAATPIPLDDVEPIESLFKRFCTGAMSHGALSSEAHECLAIAMNRIGGKSNSGEGGEHPSRFHRDENGDWRNSQIKQIASGRFGVTPEYLISAKELQIKMAQGAKPGEGGQLPGGKVNAEIAFIRHTVPGVTLISPPPHHDIYSIEDLAQLIYDLKQVNPHARVSVKLVAQAGVGTVAAGVAKAYADTIIISGHDGGTGASPITSIKNTGISWELGLAEAQQVLMENNLRGRVLLHADGGFKTGRDVIIAALLGAEEYGFGTAALVAAGCVMARQCHLNTCPVGVASQREDLRAKFPGKPEHVVNFFTFVAHEVREILASMGMRRLDDIIGRTDLLQVKTNGNYPKTHDVDLTPLFYSPGQIKAGKKLDQEQGAGVSTRPEPLRAGKSIMGRNDRPADWRPIDDTILQDARDAISDGRKLTLSYEIKNTDRTVGGRIAGEIAYGHGDKGLPADTLTLEFTGSAGQSFGAFCINGLRLNLTGEANDYVGKVMHGGVITVKPRAEETYAWHENSIIGNTVMYGATGGCLYAAGRAGERFAVRNSGGTGIVEGVGDHGCEYMTGGTVVVLGETGRNFGAGMSGGIAYVLDTANTFERRYNPDMIGIERVEAAEDQAMLRDLVERHAAETGSPHAKDLLANWETVLGSFWKVVPHPDEITAKPQAVEAVQSGPTMDGTAQI